MPPVTNNTVPQSQAYTYSAPAGVPGDVSRPGDSKVEPGMLQPVASVYAQSYGIAMVDVAGGFAQFGPGNAATDFAAVLVRQAPGISENDQGLTGNIPNAVQTQGLLVQGYINVLCGYGTPTRGLGAGGGVVYVRTVANANNPNVGTFDATSDPGNNVALTATQATWATDGKDSNNNAELRVWR
jgi:hypothetical protein